MASRAEGAAGATGGELPRLSVSPDGRHLVRADDGGAFFWLADTAWYLADLPPADVDDYLRDRASRGFNIIQGPIIIRKLFDHEQMMPNYTGDFPLAFTDDRPALNERYLRHIDYIVERALKHGLYIAPAVIWGSVLDQIFLVDNPGLARDIGRQLGRRYKDKSNVIWIVCGEYHKIAWETAKGDRTRPTYRELALVNALAEGLESGHEGAHLMTIHPDGSRSSSEHFHDAAWLDFNMIQTFSIKRSTANLIRHDWERMPAKPVVNAEPAYEDRNINFTNDPITPRKVRYEAYHSVFQGAFGHTYGHWDIWQATDNWRSALGSEGARSMTYLRALMESRPAVGREPYQTMVDDTGGITARSKRYLRRFMQDIGLIERDKEKDLLMMDAREYYSLRKHAAVRGPNGNYAFIYFPNSDIAVDIHIGALSGNKINTWWFQPADGRNYTQQAEPTNKPFLTAARESFPRTFIPPATEHGNDWVLVLDDAVNNFGPPGSIINKGN